LTALADLAGLATEAVQPLKEALTELQEAATAYVADRIALVSGLAAFCKPLERAAPKTNAAQHQVRQAFEPLAERTRGLVKQIDLLYKLASRAGQLANALSTDHAAAASFDRRGANRQVKQLDDASGFDLGYPYNFMANIQKRW